jgi:hypothetical protein
VILKGVSDKPKYLAYMPHIEGFDNACQAQVRYQNWDNFWDEFQSFLVGEVIMVKCQLKLFCPTLQN